MQVTVFGYARVSTQDQSVERQIDELTAAGADEMRAETGSGKRDADRPVWNELLRNLRSGDGLMVTELSRLGRSTSQLAKLADDLRDRRVTLRILNLGIDTGTPSGKLVYSIIAAVAEMERDLLIERTMSGLAASRARGRVGGRKPSLTPSQIRRVRQLYDAQDLTVREIAQSAGVSRQTIYRYLGPVSA
jgi:DNA invertase Pin-like site-specific DNA recombinase